MSNSHVLLSLHPDMAGCLIPPQYQDTSDQEYHCPTDQAGDTCNMLTQKQTNKLFEQMNRRTDWPTIRTDYKIIRLTHCQKLRTNEQNDKPIEQMNRRTNHKQTNRIN